MHNMIEKQLELIKKAEAERDAATGKRYNDLCRYVNRLKKELEECRYWLGDKA